MQNHPIRVFVRLTSSILCLAMEKLLECDSRIRCFASNHAPPDFVAHVIVVDATSLRESDPDSPGKYILIDTGLPPDEIITLFRNYHIHGLISRDCSEENLLLALHSVHSGYSWIDSTQLLSLLREPSPLPSVRLTKREHEIVLLVSKGETNRTIASLLFISEQTVKTHVSRILKKSRLANRIQLASLALQLK